MTRTVPLLATLLFALAIAVGFARPSSESHASFEISELEFAVRQPDGSTLAAHFLVQAPGEKEAFRAALSTVNDLYPGATVQEAGHGHEDEADHDDHDDEEGPEGVRAQWMPWGWTWDEDELPVPVHYNALDAPSFFSADDVAEALEIWSSVPSSSFAFEYRGETAAPPSMNQDSRPDGDNVIAWQDLGCDVGCVLGLTTKSFETHEVDISLNTHAGARLGDGTDGSFDVMTVLLHELGHMAGLEHSCPALGPCNDDEREAVMFYSYAGVRHELGADDIDGLTALYPEPGGVTSSVPVEEHPTQSPNPPSYDGSDDSAATVQLDAGWNLTLLPAGDIEELLGSLSCVEAIYIYDGADGWSHWVRDLYPALQTIDEIDPTVPYWVLAANACQVFYH